jgi:outer membrane protein
MKAWISALSLIVISLHSGPAFSVNLMDLFTITVNQDPRIRIAESETKIGEAIERQNLGGLLPQISASSSLSRNRFEEQRKGLPEDPDYYSGETYSLNMQQPLFDISRYQSYNASKARNKASRNSFKDILGSVSIDLVDLYTRVLTAEDNVELVIAERRAIDKQLDQVQSRYQRQLAVITDLLEVEARRDAILSEEISAINEVAITREALAEVVGRPVNETLAPVVDKIDFTIVKPMDYWIKQALTNNASLHAKQNDIEAAKADLAQVKAEHYPTVSLSLSARKSDTGSLNEATQGSREIYYGALQFNVPLYSGGSTSARVAEYRQRLTIAEQRNEEIRRAVLKQVRASYLTTKASLNAIKAAQKARDSAIKSLEAREQAFKFGTVTVVNVLDTLREKFRAERDYKHTQYVFLLSLAQLEYTTQADPYEGIEKLNNWLVTE